MQGCRENFRSPLFEEILILWRRKVRRGDMRCGGRLPDQETKRRVLLNWNVDILVAEQGAKRTTKSRNVQRLEMILVVWEEEVEFLKQCPFYMDSI